MIGVLSELNVQPMAINQPIDFDIPESIVMLAVYLSIPEAENTRRGRNTSDGMRRARKLGSWPGKAPIGYANITEPNGKKLIVPKQPEAEYIKWSFEQFATGAYSIGKVRKMVCLIGLRCEKNNFWRLLHNPVYCGIVKVSATRDEEMQFIKGIHEPLISEELFQSVQSLLNSKRRLKGNKENLKTLFPLRRFLNCPYCNRRLTGSRSQGRHAKYRYYHCCSTRCRGRFKADLLENAYEEQLKDIRIKPQVGELLKLIMEDENILTTRKALMQERKEIFDELLIEQQFTSRTRKLFVDEKIDFEDFSRLKKEQIEKLNCLHGRLTEVNEEIKCNENDANTEWTYMNSNILFSYKNQDIVGKRSIINLFRPSSINPNSGALNPVEVNAAIAQIIEYNQKSA